MKITYLIAVLCIASRGLCDGLPPGPYIYTVGQASVSVDPDIIRLSVEVSGVDMDQQAARKKAISQSAAVFAMLKAVGIPDGDVSSHRITLTSEYEYGDRRERTFKGYRVTQSIMIVVHDAAKFSEVTTRLIGGSVSKLEVEKVDSSKRAQQEHQLMEQALQDARRQAEDIAKVSGLQITSVFAVAPVPFGSLRESFLGTGMPEPWGRAISNGGDSFDIRLPKVEMQISTNVIFEVKKPQPCASPNGLVCHASCVRTSRASPRPWVVLGV